MTEQASNPFLLTMLISKPLTADANTSFKLNPCINIPKTPASTEENIMTGNVGYFFTAPNNIRAGGNNNSIFQLNIVFKVVSIVFIVSGAATSLSETLNPAIKYITIDTIAAGIVVHHICLICSYKSLQAVIGAIFVVSDKGDRLALKYALATIAPAVVGRLASMPVAIHIDATPIVPADPHDVPETIDITAET